MRQIHIFFKIPNATVCLIIHVFCKSCELEIVQAVLQIKTKSISLSQTLQNTWIIKQIVVLFWKFWRKYESVSYLFCCDNYWSWFQELSLPRIWEAQSFPNFKESFEYLLNWIFQECTHEVSKSLRTASQYILPHSN